MLWKTKRKRALRVGVVSDVGQVRSENQDSWGIYPESRNGEEVPNEQLFLVADGMGGHEHGQEASRMAARFISEYYFAHANWEIEDRLDHAFQVANKRIWARSNEGEEKMGTTCTALALLGREFYLAHVGDSRCYRINEEGIEQVTTDHTLVEEMRREGVLTEEEALHHPRRHALMRALGIREETDIDILGPFPVKMGDRYLLCSDGLAPVQNDELHRLVMATNVPQEACETLVALANERGGPDNVTVLVVSF